MVYHFITLTRGSEACRSDLSCRVIISRFATHLYKRTWSGLCAAHFHQTFLRELFALYRCRLFVIKACGVHIQGLSAGIETSNRDIFSACGFTVDRDAFPFCRLAGREDALAGRLNSGQLRRVCDAIDRCFGDVQRLLLTWLLFFFVVCFGRQKDSGARTIRYTLPALTCSGGTAFGCGGVAVPVAGAGDCAGLFVGLYPAGAAGCSDCSCAPVVVFVASGWRPFRCRLCTTLPEIVDRGRCVCVIGSRRRPVITRLCAGSLVPCPGSRQCCIPVADCSLTSAGVALRTCSISAGTGRGVYRPVIICRHSIVIICSVAGWSICLRCSICGSCRIVRLTAH